MSRKSRLPEYRSDTETVFAAQITDIELYTATGLEAEGQAARLWFGPNKKSNLRPSWVNENHPVIGGYFVVFDDALPIFMSESAFTSTYRGA